MNQHPYGHALGSISEHVRYPFITVVTGPPKWIKLFSVREHKPVFFNLNSAKFHPSGPAATEGVKRCYDAVDK